MAASLRYQQLAENCIRVLHLDGLDGRNILQCALPSILLDDDVDCDAIPYAWKNEKLQDHHAPKVPGRALRNGTALSLILKLMCAAAFGCRDCH